MAKKGVVANAFKNNSSITSVKFGKDCGFVEEFAFTACSSLNEINVDNVIETINKNTFANTNLYSATFRYTEQTSLPVLPCLRKQDGGCASKARYGLHR